MHMMLMMTKLLKENGDTSRDNRFCPEKFLPLHGREGGGGGGLT